MAQTQPMTVRLPHNSRETLARLARRLGTSPSEAGARLIEEGLRVDRFGLIEFRSNLAGRTAYLKGTRLPVFMVAMALSDFGGDIEKTAAHFGKSTSMIQAAHNYSESFADEIDLAIADYKAMDYSELSKLLPGIRQTRVKC